MMTRLYVFSGCGIHDNEGRNILVQWDEIKKVVCVTLSERERMGDRDKGQREWESERESMSGREKERRKREQVGEENIELMSERV